MKIISYYISGGRIFEDFYFVCVIFCDDDFVVIGVCYDRYGFFSIIGCLGIYRIVVKYRLVIVYWRGGGECIGGGFIRENLFNW